MGRLYLNHRLLIGTGRLRVFLRVLGRELAVWPCDLATAFVACSCGWLPVQEHTLLRLGGGH